MTKTKIIISRIERFLGSSGPQKFWDIYFHLNTFRNGTTHNQLNQIIRRKQFVETDYKTYKFKEELKIE